MTEHKCEYAQFEDWEGDPDIPNGKHYIYEVKCIYCGEPAPDECPICGAEINDHLSCGCYEDIHYGRD